MLKAELLERTRREWKEWDSLLSLVLLDVLSEPIRSEAQFIRDLIAHLTWYEKEMVGLLERKDFFGSDWWNLPPDDRNQNVWEANQHKSLEVVQQEAVEIRNRLSSLLESLTDSDLVEPRNFPGMPEDWMPWEVIEVNVSEHYHEHASRLREWLAQEK